MDRLTFGQLRDLLDRASDCASEWGPRAEHHGLALDLRAAADLIRDEIGASHMGTGADEVVIERGDNGDEEDEDDGERDACAACGESYNATESDASDPDTYCSADCEAEDTGREVR